ncbi:sulfotransferase family protein [Salinibacter altiplanensis]|uniref:sulfotransferase family protein n=1 Tax=Salinibacter altiplanensis TaxID=1803181 RepID=UPI000C9F3661|nr:sulfotransferase [Salinibacter altiplanensis]
MATMPNTFVIGAAKSGTTSLYDYLRQHPDVFMSPVKEPCYFAYAENPPVMAGPGDEEANRESGVVYTTPEYESLFSEATSEAIVGEASPVYLYDKDAPRLLHEQCPEASLIAILRNPVVRAHSHYLQLIQSGREPLDDFEAALDAEDERVDAGWEWSWHYRRMGLYGRQLARYLEYFDREQLHVYRFEELTADPAGFAQTVYRALGVDPSFTPDTGVRRRATGVPTLDWLHRFIGTPDHVLRRWARLVLPEALRDRILMRVRNANLRKPPLPRAARARLAEAYAGDVHRLETLLDRSFSDWLTTDENRIANDG